MPDSSEIDPAVWKVIEDYEARAQRDEQLWETLTEAEVRERLDEFLLPVGRAAGTLMNLIIREARARRILEVGSSYGYSTTWLAEAARAVGGQLISLELRAAKTEYARAQLARARLEGVVEFRVGDALASLAQLAGPFDFVLIDLWKDLYSSGSTRSSPRAQSSLPTTCCSPRAPGRTRALTASGCGPLPT